MDSIEKTSPLPPETLAGNNQTKTTPCLYIALGVLIFLIYSNSFVVPWLMDDLPNIIDNPPIRIDNLMPETLWQTFFALPLETGKLYRPVSCLSFALNWFIGQDNTIGYHIVNLIIHYLNTILLFHTILLIFKTPGLYKTNKDKVFFIALLGAVLWAVNPINTQAVTYIVERMASLAAFFFLGSFFWYLKARTTEILTVRYYVFSVISFLLALGSKENTILLPASLLLSEYIFFSKEHKNTLAKNIFRLLVALNIVIILMGIFYCWHKGYFNNFFGGWGSRPFSLYQRILTEPRIIFFYLSLIFYPLPARLSLNHDIYVSTSPISPWTTLSAIISIVVIILFSFRYSRTFPLLCFAVLFFFLTHAVESTIIPLELIFEHRNYLPSFFLFVPIAAALFHGLSHYLKANKFIYVALSLFIPLLIISIGTGTYIRNMSYSSPKAIWTDAMLKAPNSARPLATLGIISGWGKDNSPKNLQKALALHYKALNSYTHNIKYRVATISNMAGLYYNYDMFKDAIKLYRKCLTIQSDFLVARYNLARTYLRDMQFQKGLTEINYLIEDMHHQRSDYFNVQGILLLWLDRPKSATKSFQKAMRLAKEKNQYFYNIGVALSRSGHYKQADWFLKQATKSGTNNMRPFLSIIENKLLAGDLTSAKQETHLLIRRFSIIKIKYALEFVRNDYRSCPVDIDLIKPIIADVISKTANNFSTR